MNKKVITPVLLLVLVFILGVWKFTSASEYRELSKAPRLSQLNDAISKAQAYYEGLYWDAGSEGAVVLEFYSHPKSVYTVRHATIGGYYYYTYIGDFEKAEKLKRFSTTYGFDPEYDLHSLIWRSNVSSDDFLYSNKAYPDCNANLPEFGNVLPYRSKVCKLGDLGFKAYLTLSKYDTFLPMLETLQGMSNGKQLDQEKINSFEQDYRNLGFGMPTCNPAGCSSIASAFRTAHFGEIELRLGRYQYADAVASDLISAQEPSGAIYLSYNENREFETDKPVTYLVLDALLNDEPIYDGFIPTNAETMSSVLAFLLHYRCDRFMICQ